MYVTSVCTSVVLAFVVHKLVCGLFSNTVSDTGDGFDVMSYMLGSSNLVGKEKCWIECTIIRYSVPVLMAAFELTQMLQYIRLCWYFDKSTWVPVIVSHTKNTIVNDVWY